MAKIRFTKRLGTINYGMVEPGDEIEVSDRDARGYIDNGFADKIEPTPKRRPVRNGKEG